MNETIQNITSLKDILKKDNIDNDIFEIASRFGAIKNALSYDDELSSSLNDIENILKKSLMSGGFKMEDKLELFSMFGALENHLKNSSLTDENKLLNSVAGGLSASAGARVLMKAGPMGMLAAGVLGVATTYILQNNEEPHIANKDLLTIAYYLSRFDHEYLFGLHLSSAKAIDAIGDVLNVKPNTIRGKRDYFDSLLPQEDRKSSRKGYNEIKSTKIYEEIIEKYSYITNNDEQRMRKVIVDILGKYQDGLSL
ncbi:hypothetical protein [Sulfurimonas sp.]|uniref:hypothetical protein n=1 Tax=Sulfurimonas sp. TaxID=2022749 RepID=UPI002AB255A5|nr:hypothetical protein [Sulfurimonas sp.]